MTVSAARGGVGILGIGTYLPPEIRRNDWWPAATVARWTAGQARGVALLRGAPAEANPGARDVARAMVDVEIDPFGGVIERRILAADQTSTDMEAAAARVALADAGVAAADVDLLLIHTAVPEYLLSNTACILHHRLGLPTACMALEAQASAYSFLAQLALALPLIETGRARHALLVQSCAVSRLMDPDDLFSARCGDAATAVVIGPVGAGHGVLAMAHRVDGSRPRTLVAAAASGRWYDGPSRLAVPDPAGAQRVFLETVDQSREVIGGVLADAGLGADQIDFFAVHQGTPWLRRLVQDHAGLTRAGAVDLFPRIGYVFAASIPLVLAAAVSDRVLVDHALVVMMGGGTGMTYGASALRWGRGRS